MNRRRVLAVTLFVLATVAVVTLTVVLQLALER